MRPGVAPMNAHTGIDLKLIGWIGWIEKLNRKRHLGSTSRQIRIFVNTTRPEEVVIINDERKNGEIVRQIILDGSCKGSPRGDRRVHIGLPFDLDGEEIGLGANFGGLESLLVSDCTKNCGCWDRHRTGVKSSGGFRWDAPISSVAYARVPGGSCESNALRARVKATHYREARFLNKTGHRVAIF